jgi:hypothetical protein
MRNADANTIAPASKMLGILAVVVCVRGIVAAEREIV